MNLGVRLVKPRSSDERDAPSDANGHKAGPIPLDDQPIRHWGVLHRVLFKAGGLLDMQVSVMQLNDPMYTPPS